MRRVRLLAGVLIVAGCLAGGKVALAGDSPQGDQPFIPPAVRSSSEEQFVGDMVSILNETQSPDAFLATVLALHRAKVEGKRVVPAIIHNAERLKLFADTPPEQGTEQQKAVLKCVLLLLKRANGVSPVKQTRKVRVDPNVRMEQLLFQSEDLRQIQDEWRRLSIHDQPAHMTYERVHGDIGP